MKHVWLFAVVYGVLVPFPCTCALWFVSLSIHVDYGCRTREMHESPVVSNDTISINTVQNERVNTAETKFPRTTNRIEVIPDAVNFLDLTVSRGSRDPSWSV